jgi:predicted DNA-binding transcriptional regulator AlpA
MPRSITTKAPRCKRAAPVVSLDLSADRLLSTAEAARMVGLTQKTLRQLRCERRGPRCLKTGDTQQARVRYPLSGLQEWVSQMRVRGG